MKKIIISVLMTLFITLCGSSFAADVSPIPISAEQAFDSVQTQTDPISGEVKSVALIDVRTRAEFYWVGSACQVDEIITTTGDSIIPDYGKVLLAEDGRFIRFEINGRNKRLQVRKVSEIALSPIALNIPYKLWDEATATSYENPDFGNEVEALAGDYDVLIFFCRSGGRSEDCLGEFDTSLFYAIYEIDQPDGKSGRGGFEGTSYSNVYNGYRGFPERLTELQEHSSVSWKDTGLPMKTSVNPLAE
jgi:rhodanese-related sulfurtransferase